MFILCLLTAFIWGITNWYLKEGSTGLQKIHYDNRIKQFGAEIWYFFTNAKYWVPFLLNQCGSVLYYYSLSKTDISTAVPVTNALTLVVTYVCDVISHPQLLNSRFVIGMLCVSSGVALCVLSKDH
ncbi:unnamed protein product [Adineta steineri]|uniref:Uncharacterized protein n=1 Tax=Adineta steineri TaxID=433720 RepID=A0A818NVF3_9BILA|nr:unnamed protein product [Adineta steineri]CAF1300128.1 unnamed protein product [Adineta steineri]CAF1331503.1 unnamed protein product [Adineta steineri]CAF1413506.1 unnamed protein product [Adineta steineri]CAF3609938.1 unnamed protein product [Adineta steineri]